MVGIDGLTLVGQDLTVAINQGAGTRNGVANTTVVDFSGSNALKVITGPDPDGPDPAPSVTLDFDGSDGKILRASGRVIISIDSFVFLAGEFALEKRELFVRDRGQHDDDASFFAGHRPERCARLRRHRRTLLDRQRQ